MNMDDTDIGTNEASLAPLGEDERFSAGGFVKADDIAETGPEDVTIVNVRKGVFDGKVKAILIFEDGRELALNPTREKQLKAIAGQLTLSAVRGVSVRLTVARVQGPNGKVNSVQIGKAVAF